MEGKKTITTITVDVATAEVFDRMAKAAGVSKKEILSLSADYFERYGINPATHESPAQEMNKLIKRVDQVVAFQKVQERDILRPACELIVGNSSAIRKSVEGIPLRGHFNSWESRINSNMQEMKNAIEAMNRRQEDAMKFIAKFIDAKGKTGLLSDISEVYNKEKRKI